jgi:hypothetical protein
MKIVSFSIYKDNPKLFNYYLRGLYWNMRFIRLLLPDWEMMVVCSREFRLAHKDLLNGLGVNLFESEDRQRCYNMLRRMHPAYYTLNSYEKILCRDSDACITYREVQEIRKWEESGKDWHGINDNPAHSIPLMGGMIGFKSEALRRIFPTFEALSSNHDLSRHGSDQDLIMKRIWPEAQKSFYHSDLKDREPHPQPDPKWTSNLIQRYIGCAGIIEMEALRFLADQDPENHKWEAFEKQFPKLFYWHE